MKVTISTNAVAVEQEPQHKVVFKNDYVRIIDAQLPPGYVTLNHRHETIVCEEFLRRISLVIQAGVMSNETSCSSISSWRDQLTSKSTFG